MARTNKNMEWTMIDANVKSNYINKGQFGNLILYSFFRSFAGKLVIGFVLLSMLSALS